MYTGLTASLMVGEKKVGYISNWSVEETRDMIEVTQLGKAEKEKVPALYGWTASAEGTADFTDGGQEALRQAMLGGVKVTVKFYLVYDETAANATTLTGDAYVESMSYDIAAEDKGNISISLAGTGALALAKPAATPAV